MSVSTSVSRPRFTEFAASAGRPSHYRFMSHADRYVEEDFFVVALRGYARALAQQCHADDPGEYGDFVADLTEVQPGDAPTLRDVRLAYLLHSYAEYIPSPDCEFMWLGEEYHAWQSPDSTVVVDVVTTLEWKELAHGEDEYKVFEASQQARLSFGNDLFVGVRHIVLDSPHESTWYPADGEPQPLLTSDICPAVTEAGDFR